MKFLPQSCLRGVISACLAAPLAGCATQAIDRAPAVKEAQWKPAPGSEGANLAEQARQNNALSLSAPVNSLQTYTLPQLIDLAQRTNPQTRTAWEAARQAALGVGIAESTYLPVLTANVIAGHNNNSVSLPIPIGNDGYFNSSADTVVPFMALQWLAFDFGGRSSIVNAAKQLSLASNYQFNVMHHKLIFDVTGAYHAYNAARAQARIASEALANGRKVRDAVQARRERGLATSVELAQVEQLLAQSELRIVNAKGNEDNAYQALLGAVGISPMSRINVVDTRERRLPSPSSTPVDTMIRIALANRPDIMAGYASLEATKLGIQTAEAQFFPKISVYATASKYQTSLGSDGLPSISNRGINSNITVAVSIPLYDSGMRAANLKQAQSRVEVAQQQFNQLKDAAAREIVVAANTLKTAIQANASAVKLRQAAYKTYDSALEAYQNGLGTVSALAETQNGLLNAKLAESDARAATFTAAANLAFVLGASADAS